MPDCTPHLVECLKDGLATGKPVMLPAGGRVLWDWFMSLHQARSWHMSGPNPISYADMLAYCILNGLPLPIAQRHLDTLTALDRAFLDFHAARPPAIAEGSKAVSRRPGRMLTAELFDVMFG